VGREKEVKSQKYIMRILILLSVLFIGLCCSAQTKDEEVARHSLTDCQWITAGTLKHGLSLPVFHRSFEIGKKPRNAILQATALGIYDVTINGQRVGQHELKPGWTDYRKEVTCQLLKQLLSILLTLFGMLIDFKDVQFSKQLTPKEVMPSGSVTEVMSVQLRKQLLANPITWYVLPW